MTTVKLTERLRTWQAYHPEWRQDVRCALYLADRSVVLIDPQLPQGSAARRLLAEIDAHVLGQELPLHVLCTVFWHERSARALLDRYGERASWRFPVGPRELPRGARRLHAGASLPGGLRALPTARGGEVLLWLPREGTLFAGDVLLGGKREPLRVCPQSWLRDGITRADLAASIRPALELGIEIVHVGHGAPVTGGAREALAAALDRCEASEP